MQIIWKIANWLSSLIGVRGDCILHFGVCSLSTLIIGFISFVVIHPLLGYIPALVGSLFGAVFSAGISLGKEYGDIPNSGWSWYDLVADGLGILIGYTFLIITICLVNVNFHIA